MAILLGEKNCITDVTGVRVGHVTLEADLVDGEAVRTGVTAILPHGGNLFKRKVAAASYVINGYGKSTGLIQVNELGLIESPIMLTNTFGVASVLSGTLNYLLDENPCIGQSSGSVNVLVGECNDSYLNSMRLQSVKDHHAVTAIQSASENPAEQGAVGAGKGMVCFGYKGGIGRASRRITCEDETYTLGTLVLSNFGKRQDALFANFEANELKTPDGSIMIVIATDAPLEHRQLKRLAKRSAAGLGRLGSYYANGSGDIAIAFTTANEYTQESSNPVRSLRSLNDDHSIMNELFEAVVQCVEESVINSLKYAETTKGRKNRIVEKAPI